MKEKSKGLKTKTLQLISLGGLGEVGRNTWIFALESDWIIIDAGLGFPFNEYPGVELIFPDIDFLIENKEKVKAIVITHAHEDHIGGAVRLISALDIPKVYGSRLTLALLEKKFEETGTSTIPDFIKVSPRETKDIATLNIEFIRTTHSVPDCFALLITTPFGKILLTGDFKFDFTPLDGEQFDIPRLVEVGNEGIKLLISDSTNVERAGFSSSEITVGPNLTRVFSQAKKRIFITTFSSHVHRIQQIMNAALSVNRKVCIAGYSMEVFCNIARDIGYLKYSDDLVIPLEEALKLPEDELVIITTGSQGEPTSILSKMARKEHKILSVLPGDTIIFSANPIPGNERSVSKLQDTLCALGANLIYGRSNNIHVSGHGCQEELKLMIALTRPEYFIPAHGDYRMQVLHAEIGANMGINPEKVYIMDNGDALEINEKGFNITKNLIKVPPVYYDMISGGIVDPRTLKDRVIMGQEGIIILFIAINTELEIQSIDIIHKGITFNKGVTEEKLIEDIRANINKAYERMKKFGTADVNNLYNIGRDLTLKATENKLCCRPLVIAYVQESQ